MRWMPPPNGINYATMVCCNNQEGGIHVGDQPIGDRSCQEQLSGLWRQDRVRGGFQQVSVAVMTCPAFVGSQALYCGDGSLGRSALLGADGAGTRP